MAQIDTHRAAYNRPNPQLHCGKKPHVTPSTVTEDKRVFYTLRFPDGRSRVCNTLSEVNNILLLKKASVVKTTRIITTKITHERVK